MGSNAANRYESPYQIPVIPERNQLPSNPAEATYRNAAMAYDPSSHHWVGWRETTTMPITISAVTSTDTGRSTGAFNSTSPTDWASVIDGIQATLTRSVTHMTASTANTTSETLYNQTKWRRGESSLRRRSLVR